MNYRKASVAILSGFLCCAASCMVEDLTYDNLPCNLGGGDECIEGYLCVRDSTNPNDKGVCVPQDQVIDPALIEKFLGVADGAKWDYKRTDNVAYTITLARPATHRYGARKVYRLDWSPRASPRASSGTR